MRFLLLILAFVVVTAVDARAAVIVVTTDSDADATDGFCSLREAIFAANLDLPHNECPAGAGDDRIQFDLTLPETIGLTADLPAVTESLAVEGPGRELLEILGNSLYAAFDFATPPAGAFLRIADLTIRGTSRADGGAAVRISSGDQLRLERVALLQNAGQGYGGAVDLIGLDSGPVVGEILDSLFDGNSTSGFGGGAMRVSSGTLRIAGTTFVGNTASAGNGGALMAFGSDVTIERSTFSDNEAEDFGGALYVTTGFSVLDTAVLVLRDSTITANRANTNGIELGGGGGVVFTGNVVAPGTLSMRNTIVAGNEDLSASNQETDLDIDTPWTLITTGWNLIGDPTGADAWFPPGTPNGDADFVGTAAAPLDPLLDPLADYGGPTPTHRPIIDAASLVIDHGSCPDAELDQRGHGGGLGSGRIVEVPNVPDDPQSDLCDIGAFERNTPESLPSAIFADGFESVTTLVWSAELP